MDRYKKLLGDSLIFAIGNFGSKLISFVLVPFYTFVLSKQEFGTVDLITTTMNMLLPIITLSIFDAVFRFTLDKDTNKYAILSNGLFISLSALIVSILFIPILEIIKVPYPVFIYLLLFTGALSSLFLNFSRAVNRIKVFATAGIIGTFIIAISNVFFLLFLNLGVVGYLCSIILSNVIVTLYVVIRIKCLSKIKFKYVNKSVIKNMLMYSIPLIPNSFAWWINSSADRYFILLFLGTSANGIYAVASKIPSILNLLNQIFFQSWQLSAVKEFNSDDASKFYSNIFNYYLSFQFIIISLILVILKPVMHIIVSDTYYTSWKYIPFLLIAVLYSSLSGFIGTTYTAAKYTTKIFITTILGAIINILFGFLIIPLLGLQGASLASSLSFLVVLIIRIIDSKNIVRILVDVKNALLNHFAIIIMITILFSKLNTISIMLLNIGIFILVLIINRKLIMNIKQIKRKNI